jgi:hypothetical protein
MTQVAAAVSAVGAVLGALDGLLRDAGIPRLAVLPAPGTKAYCMCCCHVKAARVVISAAGLSDARSTLHLS